MVLSRTSTCFCVDFRRVNTITCKDAYPIPRVDDSLESLAQAKYFNTLDLVSGYWQVEVTREDQGKTAFCTHKGPFELCSTPAMFQCIMDRVLAGTQWSSCLVYVDDFLIVCESFQGALDEPDEYV